jgi:ribonuclease G
MPALELLVDAVPGELRVAVLRDGALTDFLIDRSGQCSMVGGIYLGRVLRVAGTLDAAFVDIGDSRPALLNLADARPWPQVGGEPKVGRDRIGDYVREGDALIVQVIADPLPGKGARLSARPRIAGRLVALEPGRTGPPLAEGGAADGVAMSAGLVPEGRVEGIVVLGAAADSSAEELAADLARVHQRRARIEAARAAARAPACLEGPADAVQVAIATLLAEAPHRIVAEGPDALGVVRQACASLAPQWHDRIEHTAPGTGLFDSAGVSEALADAYRPMVPLADGGDIRLAVTPALIAVDVNSGASEKGQREQATFALNCNAAATVARLLRLRNEAGAVVVDFVPLRSRAKGRALVESVRASFTCDPVPVRIAGFGPLGFIELTRARRRAPLSAWLWRDSEGLVPGVPSDAAAAFEAARRLAGGADQLRAGAILLQAAPGVVAALERGVAASALAWARQRAGRAVRLAARPDAPDGWFDVGADGG